MNLCRGQYLFSGAALAPGVGAKRTASEDLFFLFSANPVPGSCWAGRTRCKRSPLTEFRADGSDAYARLQTVVKPRKLGEFPAEQRWGT